MKYTGWVFVNIYNWKTETIDAICGFSKQRASDSNSNSHVSSIVKTAVHTILCHRQVYPPSEYSEYLGYMLNVKPDVFTRKQRYRIPVWVSRHPGLNGYIDDVINATRVQIQKVGR